MIINTGGRTDIAQYFSDWLLRRFEEGYVLVRNPFNPVQVTKYRFDPSIVDLIVFCSKNPGPMLPYMNLLKPYKQYWFITITPYGRDIEPNVPEKELVIDTFCSRKHKTLVMVSHYKEEFPACINRTLTLTPQK